MNGKELKVNGSSRGKDCEDYSLRKISVDVDSEARAAPVVGYKW